MGPEQVNEMIERCRQTGYMPDGTRACLLCGDHSPHEAMFVGLWIPPKDLQRRRGCLPERLTKGGSRIVIYMICPGCFQLPTLADDVVDKILSKWSVQ
jgi:hypothetical protein